MSKSKFKILLGFGIFVVLLSFASIFYFFILGSPSLLFAISKKFDEPSTPYYMVIERIYKISKGESINDQLIEKLNQDKNPSMNDYYARILGVMGEDSALGDLVNIYYKYRNNKNYQKTIDYIVLSIGLIGDESAVAFLEEIKDESETQETLFAGSTLAVAIYLLSGNTDSEFRNMFGNRQTLKLTNNLIEARQIIVNSKNRKRNLNEMIVLDCLFRPPEGKWSYVEMNKRVQ
jgi:hypothetical protein